MKTLYTGHVTIDAHDIYSFIYAETLLEAEAYLSTLLQRYVCERCHHAASASPAITVVSRPGGWEPPDGYYLPGTSKQYALKYTSLPLSDVTLDVESSSDGSCPSQSTFVSN